MYAIINISGKQFKVIEGNKLRIPLQTGESGEKLSCEDVLLINSDGSIQVGEPNLSDAKVTVKILNHGRERKILVYKKKRRKGYQRKNGHRQWYTDVEVEKIEISSAAKKNVSSKKAIKTKISESEEE